MLAASNGRKDVVLILAQKGANLDLVNAVSNLKDMLYYNPILLKTNYNAVFLRK